MDTEARPGLGVAMRTLVGRADRTLVVVGLAILACVPVCAALAVFDARVLDGSNLWLKPLKFQISVGTFLLTLAVMVPLASEGFRRSWLGRAAVWTAICTSVFEIVWITLQAGLGQRSHYATDTAFGAMMYALMGIAAALLSLTPVMIALGAMWTNRRDPRLASARWGVALGSLIAFVGAAGIGVMLAGSPNHYPIDAQDQSSRIPIAGWSLERGDLRIAHFVGLHALQGLFTIGLIMTGVPIRWARAMLSIAALVWLVVILWLARTALEGASPFAWFG